MISNCSGCKWLDRYRVDGNGYCSMVVRSKTFHGASVSKHDGRLFPSSCVRRANMLPCEFYEPGNFVECFQEV